MITTSPDWHEQILSTRQAQIDSGEQVPMDWKQAKQEILNKIKQDKNRFKN